MFAVDIIWLCLEIIRLPMILSRHDKYYENGLEQQWESHEADAPLDKE